MFSFEILFNHFAFLLSVFGLFFVPGAFWISFFRHRIPTLSLFRLEYVVISFAVSLALLDFGMMALAGLDIPLSKFSLFAFEGLVISIPIFTLLRQQWKQRKEVSNTEKKLTDIGFTKKESLFFIGTLLLTLFLKSVFLWNTILPTSTDLGHHMYWAKTIAESRSIPEYQKIDIAFKNNENTLTAPEPIDDFIIGEHLPFAAISIVSGEDVRSSFPSIFLLLVNLLTLLSLSLLAYRLFEGMLGSKTLARRGMMITLFLAGPLWALSSPEAKYVSGGVIGNLIGNFLIPISILTLFRALQEKSAAFFALALLSMGTLAFTHHLSTLIFLFVALFSFIVFLVLFRKDAFLRIAGWRQMFLSPAPILIAMFLFSFAIFVYAPTYLDIAAVDTALGSPSKGTREGLEFSELAIGVGSARLGLELLGIGFILLSSARRTLAGAVAIGWSGGLLIMSLFPEAVFLDIPSNRVATYGTFPAAILSAFALLSLFFKKDAFVQRSLRTRRLFQWSFSLLFISVIVGGFFDNAGALPESTNAREAVQTFAVSEWLVKRTAPDEWILKDHNYLVADSWMKLFFLRDYSYPLSRGYFRRYTDEVTPREQCTLLMISAPNTPKGQSCFESTGVDTIVVNPRYDAVQFNKAKDMSLLYVSDSIAVYRKTNDK